MVILFDLDGTLADPREGFVRCIRHALEALGRPCPSDDVLATHIGPPLEQTLGALLGPDGAHLAPQAATHYRRLYAAEGVVLTRAYDGIARALERLRPLARLYVATSKPTVFACGVLEHLGLAGHFLAVHGAGPGGEGAEKGRVIHSLLERERIDPAAAVMVGDRAQDILGAAENGLPGYGAAWGYAREGELALAGARLVFSTPEAMARHFEAPRT